MCGCEEENEGERERESERKRVRLIDGLMRRINLSCLFGGIT